MEGADVGLFAIRGVLGTVMFAHGWNHVFGGGKIAGTTEWFESLGMRPARVHAWLASLTELGAGVLLVLGLLTPLAAAAVLGVMVVAGVTNHAGNGFFIFRPGEGWEYVLTLGVVALGLAGTGAGAWSLDALLGVPLNGWTGLGVAVAAGGGGAGLLLAVCWRPKAPAAT